MNKTILIIEDDADIRDSLRIILEGNEYSVIEAKDGMEGLRVLDNTVDLILLDIMMPGISGIHVCEKIREKSYVPILFLTAKDSDEDKSVGLLAGADDYLVKPFSQIELLARIKALIRRHEVYDYQETEYTAQNENIWISFKELRLNSLKNEVYIQNSKVDLTDHEYRILHLMMSYPHKVFSIQNIYESIWEEPFYNSSANTVMVHIRNLRKKIEKDPQNPQIIKNVWGRGYCLV